jgi:hypothetical protein
MSLMRVQLECGSDLLASSWHYLMLGGGLPSMGSRLLPLVMSVALLDGEAGV